MSGFLLDTNVLSEFSRSAIPPNPNVQQWMESLNPDHLYTSVLSVGEIRKGIELLPVSRKRRDREQWLESDLYGWFGGNLLPVSKPISGRWGKFAARSHQRGKPLGNIDGLLAATVWESRSLTRGKSERIVAESGGISQSRALSYYVRRSGARPLHPMDDSSLQTWPVWWATPKRSSIRRATARQVHTRPPERPL